MKLGTTQMTLDAALITLQQLNSENSSYTIGYFSEQWEQQRRCQLAAMANNSVHKLEKQLIELLDLEEQLKNAQ